MAILELYADVVNRPQVEDDFTDKQIKKETQTNFLAKFIIVDADRILNDSKEKEYFRQLLDYCRIQNAKGNTPIFIIANNPDFEYVACLHDENFTAAIRGWH